MIVEPKFKGKMNAKELTAEAKAIYKRVFVKNEEIRQRSNAFEKRMKHFRQVASLAWDVVLSAKRHGVNLSELKKLEYALNKSDHLWEGFGGCLVDPEPEKKSR